MNIELIIAQGQGEGLARDQKIRGRESRKGCMYVLSASQRTQNKINTLATRHYTCLFFVLQKIRCAERNTTKASRNSRQPVETRFELWTEIVGISLYVQIA